jgi:NAD(P)-dependent dehydrogenase (short-subunit alcohol dehydrogenase family)
MQTIVITGSTRGVGLGLAKAFLERGCNVVITGRTETTVEKALQVLEEEKHRGRVIGQACDVGDESQVQALWDVAKAAFGRVDIWLNNAALNAENNLLWEIDTQTLQNVINTNVMGTINGCNVAIRGMKRQGSGYIYNFNGLGSGGETIRGNTPYGVSKVAVAYLTKALLKETRGLPIRIGTISPGIVTTELLMKTMSANNTPRERAFVNIVGDKPETVAPWLADQILKNKRNNRYINWLPLSKLLRRFLLSPFRRRALV